MKDELKHALENNAELYRYRLLFSDINLVYHSAIKQDGSEISISRSFLSSMFLINTFCHSTKAVVVFDLTLKVDES